MHRQFTVTAALVLALAGAGLGGCSWNKKDRSNDDQSAPPAQPSQPTYDAGSYAANPATRILSILHAKNQEEVEAGRLAKRNGASDGVRRYGDMLIKDHASADDQVLATAKAANVTLMSTDEVKQLLAREKGQTQTEDPLADLRNRSGSDFDKMFAQKMQEGHRELVRMVEDAQPTVRNQRVRDLLDTMLPKLREHERMATDLINRQ